MPVLFRRQLDFDRRVDKAALVARELKAQRALKGASKLSVKPVAGPRPGNVRQGAGAAPQAGTASGQDIDKLGGNAS